MSGEVLVKEVTFKNGVREGLMKSFYPGGQLRQTFWYKNNLREDSAKWYYQEGQVFRSTPYVHETIYGIQVQYYRTGKVRARLGYKKGLRTPFFEEFNSDGKRIRDYPEIVVDTEDKYFSGGVYRIKLSLSDKSDKVEFYRGEFSGGVFDSTRCKKLNTIDGHAVFELRKSGSPTSDSTSVIAGILTKFGNKFLLQKKIPLPYNDLK